MSTKSTVLKLLLALLLLFAATPGWAQPGGGGHTEAELVAASQTLQPGKPLLVALRMKMDDHWHTYWKNPGDSGLATSIKWDLPEGFKASEIRWPAPEKVIAFDLVSYGYEGEIFLLVELETPAQLDQPEVTLKARADWLECEKTCIPGGTDLELTLAVSDRSEPGAWTEKLEKAEQNLPKPLQVQAGWKGQKLGLFAPLTPQPGVEAHFFPDQPMVISAGAPQPLNLDAGGYLLELEPDPNAQEKPERLTGILVVGEQAYQVDTPVKAELQVAVAPAKADSGLFLILLLAFGGGMILNLMPCVFPVLSLKVLGFVEHAKEEETKPIVHGAVFSLGVLLSFWAVAGALLLLRAGGEKIGWGFQLQSPVFVSCMCLLFFLIALNLFGVFEVGESLTTLGDVADAKTGLNQSFWSGVLTTLTATPCTAPFMGSAIGYTLNKSPLVSLSVFTAVALGVAFPYFLLTSVPALLKFIPRPGPWMETFKQILAFPLVFTSVWLAWVVGGLEGLDAMTWLLCALVFVAIAAWAWGRYSHSLQPTPRRLGIAFAAVNLVLGLWMISVVGQKTEGIEWVEFSPEVVQKEVAAGKPVFVDFTADWCQSCKINEKVALSSEKVKSRFQELGIVPVKADWTRRDPAITDALTRFGRNGVPLYVLYPGKGAEPVVLPEILLPGTVLEALEQVES